MKRLLISSLTALCAMLVTATAHASFAEKQFKVDPEWKTQEEVQQENDVRLDARTAVPGKESSGKKQELRFDPIHTDEKEMTNDWMDAREDLRPTVEALKLSENATITRGQFTALLVRSLYTKGSIDHCYWDIVSVQPPRFELLFRDVPVDHLYAPEICVAMRDGLVRGYGNDIFRPDQLISFTDAAKIIARAEGLTPWADPSKPKHWFDTYVYALGRRNAIPMSIASLDQMIKVSDAQEIIQRLHGNITNLPSRSADDLILAWEKKYERPRVRPAVTITVPQKPTSASSVKSNATKSTAAVSSVKPPMKSSAPAMMEDKSSRPKAWYEF